MTTRILPANEWHRLSETQLPALLPYVRPEDAQIVVVELEGRIVGCIAVLRVVHFEGFWVAPEHRGRVGVMRGLLDAMFATARRWAPAWAMAGAASDDMRHILTAHLGALPIPMDLYAVSLQQETVCRQS